MPTSCDDGADAKWQQGGDIGHRIPFDRHGQKHIPRQPHPRPTTRAPPFGLAARADRHHVSTRLQAREELPKAEK